MTRQEYEQKRQQFINEAQGLIDAGKVEEANTKMEEIGNLDKAFDTEAKAQANLRALSASPAPVPGIIGEAAFGDNAGCAGEDVYDSVEYRRAFMNFVLDGVPIPGKFKNASETTKTTDVTSVIAPTLVKKIVEKMEASGMLLPLVTKTSFPAGATIPTSSVKPTAVWVAEGGTSDTQKKPTGQIDIKGYKLRCAISMTLETSVMSLDVFETVFVANVSEAMVKAQEAAFINGTGAGQPEGILTKTPPKGQNVDIAAGKGPSYKDLIDAEAALPLAYENNAVWNMTKKTFMKFYGMTDNDGQPIARVNTGINGKPERTLLGRRTVLNEYMPSLGAAVTDDTVVAFLYNWGDYMFNTNYAMRVKVYEDDDTEDQITKAVMICDGKPVEISSLVTVTQKKGSA